MLRVNNKNIILLLLLCILSTSCSRSYLTPRQPGVTKKSIRLKNKQKKRYKKEREAAKEKYMSRQSTEAKAKMAKDKELADEWNKKSFGKKPPLIKRIKYFFGNLGKKKKPKDGIYTKRDKKRAKRRIKDKNKARKDKKKRVAKNRSAKKNKKTIKKK